MPCVGTFIPPETMAAIANDYLICAYIESFLEEGEMLASLKEIEAQVKQNFGYHLKLVFQDAQTYEISDEKPAFYNLYICHESNYHSRSAH